MTVEIMSEIQDFTIPNGLGIRIVDGVACQVIRKQRGAWKEIGRTYNLPLTREDLQFSKSGIPASVIAVALRAFEMNNPGSGLRQQLTGAMALRAAS
jgi:hypothetical protein